MKISPINFGLRQVEKNSISKDYVPTTVRHNALSDMDFNIIADTIRCQNLKNQMNVRLMNLRRNLNSCMAQDLYKK
jgi:riboflavin synthase alpha subunit